MSVIARSSPIAPLLETFAELVRANPFALAIDDGSLRFSRRELYDAAMQLAEALVRIAPAGSPIGLYLANDATFAVAALACVAAGCPHVALDVHYPMARNDEIARRAGIVATIERRDRPLVLAAGTDGVSHVPFEAYVSANHGERESELPPAPRPLELDDPFVLLFTSGSTGLPKGVVHSQRSLLHSVYPDIDVLALSEDDRSLGIWSPATIAGLRAALSALLSGARSIVRDPRSGLANVVATMRDERITIARAVPALVRAMAHVHGAREAMRYLRVLQLGGERVYGSDIDLLRPLLSDDCKISIGFGSTEAGIVAQWFVSGNARGVVPCGYPVRGTTLELIAADGSPAAIGAPGELRSTGPATALGFWNAGAIDSAAFRTTALDGSKRSYATGDLFRHDDAGRFVHAGRIDRMLKIRGQRVELGDVEAAVRRYPGVREAAVIARETAGTVQLIAFVVFETAGDRPIDGLRAALRAELPAHMVPADVRCLDEIPNLPGFKPDFAALEKLAADDRSQGRIGAAVAETQRDALTLAVMRAWNETLGNDSAGGNETWDDAGGDSLQMLLLAFRIERRIGRPISFDALAPDMRPSDLVERLRGGSSPDAERARVPTLVLCPGLEGDEPRFVRFRRFFAPEFATLVPAYLPWHAADGAASMDAIVDDVVAQILRDVPERPLLLAGYSFGGVVAHEAARRLAERGEEVAFVGMLDPNRALYEAVEPRTLRRRIAQLAANIRGVGLSRTLSMAAAFRLARTIHTRPRLLALCARRRERLPLPGEARFFFDYKMTYYVRNELAEAWRPHILELPVTLFRARSNVTNKEADLGWHRYAPRLTVEDVDGSHFSMIEGAEGERLAKTVARIAIATHNGRVS